MGNLLSDVRYCLRGFARRPLFAVVVVATLALGLSINAAIFSIYDQILLRELPVPEPDGLVNLGSPGLKQGNTSCNDGGTCDEIFSYPMFRDLERVDGPFVGIAAHRYVDANLAFEGETATGSGVARVGPVFLAARRQARRGPLARCQRRSRRRRGERRRAELRVLGVGVRRRSRPSSAARSSSTASR